MAGEGLMYFWVLILACTPTAPHWIRGGVQGSCSWCLQAPVQSPDCVPGRWEEWNDELEAIAERWVRQCYLSNDKCRDSVFKDPWSKEMRLFEVGQNIGWRRYSRNEAIPSHRDIFNDWLNESATFPYANLDAIMEFKSSKKKVCDYAQILWASTYMIGCAFGLFEDTKSQVAHLVCNYAPTGCAMGKPIYVPGGPCTLCDTASPFGHSRCGRHYSNLCSLEWLPNEGINVTNSVPAESTPNWFWTAVPYLTISLLLIANNFVTMN